MYLLLSILKCFDFSPLSYRKSDQLRRHVTYFVTKNPDYLWVNPIALVEFTGTDSDEFSNTKPHGNMIYRGEPFRRADKALLDQARVLREAHVPPRQIYRQLSNVSSPSKGLSHSKQIYNVQAYAKQKKFGPSFGGSASDQALKVFRDMQLNPGYGEFVQYLYCDKKRKARNHMF